jgi:sec-independent protein translocase protein TatC
MSTTSSGVRPKRRTWLDYIRAFGRAHQRAKVQLDSSMPLLEHLEELAEAVQSLCRSCCGDGVELFVRREAGGFFGRPLGGRKALVSIEVTENVAIFMRVSMLSGVILAMPVIVYQIMAFVLPGLTDREKKWLVLGVPFASLLFINGVAFTWYVMLPAAAPFLINFLGITTQVRPHNYFEFAASIMFWIGLSFEMPLIAFFLAELKIVRAGQLIQYWRRCHATTSRVANSPTHSGRNQTNVQCDAPEPVARKWRKHIWPQR